MNPTDQARKEARRKELKKNKKQRQLVRTAVIKGKNPTDIILELEKLDDMEFNVLAPPPLNDKVMKEKRRKLMETWHRVVHLYEKEEVDKHLDLRKMWNNYMTRKEEVMDHFDAVKTAQLVDVDDIPLPGGGAEDGTGDIPLPPKMQPKGGILKKSSILDSLRPKTCPGVPAGPPPLLSDYIDFEDIEEPKSKRIRFAATNDDKEEESAAESAAKVDDTQRKMLKMSGQDVDAYMKEMEEVHKKTEAEKAADLQNRMAARMESSQPGPPGEGQVTQQFVQMTATPAGFMVRPHLRPGMPPPGVRLPPGPPPGRPQLPPGPPPGRPPFMGGPGGPRPRGGPPHMRGGPNPQVVSAGPQLNPGQAGGPPKIVKTGSVIEAKPQMRNLLSDVTRFVPTNVKVKRDGQPLMAPSQVKKKQNDPMREVFAKHHAVAEQQPQVNKDDAYAQFMAEMEKMN